MLHPLRLRNDHRIRESGRHWDRAVRLHSDRRALGGGIALRHRMASQDRQAFPQLIMGLRSIAVNEQTLRCQLLVESGDLGLQSVCPFNNCPERSETTNKNQSVQSQCVIMWLVPA